MRGILFLAGAAMAASFFLTWLELPFAGPDLSPFAAVQDGRVGLGGDGGWRNVVFLGGFALAALAAIGALRGGGTITGLMAMLAGASPLVVFGDLILRADDIRRDLGLPFNIDLSDLEATMDLLADFVRLGVWAYVGGAVVLLIGGVSLVLAPPRR